MRFGSIFGDLQIKMKPINKEMAYILIYKGKGLLVMVNTMMSGKKINTTQLNRSIIYDVLVHRGYNHV